MTRSLSQWTSSEYVSNTVLSGLWRLADFDNRSRQSHNGITIVFESNTRSTEHSSETHGGC